MSLGRPILVTALAALVSVATPRASLAQYDQPAALHRPVATAAPRSLAARPDSSEEHGRGHPVLIGAAVGAGVGIITMAIAASGPGITDHSEDAIGYIGFASLGALLGATVGLIVAVSRD